MKSFFKLFLFFGASIFLLPACQSSEQGTFNRDRDAANTLMPATAVATATPLPPPVMATAVIPVSPSAIPTATPKPRPLIRIAAPPRWQTAVAQAISRETSDQWQWQPIITDDPAAALAAGAAEMALIPGENGLPIHTEPLALAVPFTTEWEAIAETDAQAILANGHSLVTAMPWAELTPDRKPLRVDGRHPTDDDYPFHRIWSLAAAPGLETAAPFLSELLRESMTDDWVTLTAVGDIMLARTLGWYLMQGDLAFPFARFQPLLSQSDIAVGNLETALGQTGEAGGKRYPFQSPPEAALALSLAGFDVLSLANNHAMDYGPEALQEAQTLLAEQGIQTIGAGADEIAAHAPFITQINGIRLAFLAYVAVPVEASSGFDTAVWTATATTPGLAWADPARIRQDVAHAANQADLVIVVLHSGLEYIEAPSEPQIAAAHAAIESGAALVIGHHPHILQGIEFYQDGVIAYSLGNFAFDITGPPETAVLHLWLDKNRVRQIELVPGIIQPGGQPRPASPAEAAAIRRQVYRLTNLLNN